MAVLIVPGNEIDLFYLHLVILNSGLLEAIQAAIQEYLEPSKIRKINRSIIEEAIRSREELGLIPSGSVLLTQDKDPVYLNLCILEVKKVRTRMRVKANVCFPLYGQVSSIRSVLLQINSKLALRGSIPQCYLAIEVDSEIPEGKKLVKRRRKKGCLPEWSLI